MLSLALRALLNCLCSWSLQRSCNKRVKMKKGSTSKELLIDWLRTALDYELYPGLAWSDREKGIFYVKWIHKSSEQWSGEDLEPFKAWAGHKGKLDGKNPKQLKATFRCALNSKKELKEHSRGRDRRFWQFVDPSIKAEKDNAPKKRRRNCSKVGKTRVDSTVPVAGNKNMKSATDSGLFSPKISSNIEDKMPRPTKFPGYDSFSNFQPLTPPDQTNDHSYTHTDFKFSKEDMDTLETCGSNYRHVDTVPVAISPISANNNLVEKSNEASIVLPPFETFGSFRILTPPPQMNEVYFLPTEHRTNYTPPPDQSRLTPPHKHSHISRNSYNQGSTDVWQPNCWPVDLPEKDPKGLSDFFSSDFIGLYKTSSQESENNNMDFLDMDQYVPVMNTQNIVQVPSKNVQTNLVNRSPSSNATDHPLEMKLDDFFLGDDVDPEACRRLMQEIDRSSSIPQYRLQS